MNDKEERFGVVYGTVMLEKMRHTVSQQLMEKGIKYLNLTSEIVNSGLVIFRYSCNNKPYKLLLHIQWYHCSTNKWDWENVEYWEWKGLQPDFRGYE